MSAIASHQTSPGKTSPKLNANLIVVKVNRALKGDYHEINWALWEILELTKKLPHPPFEPISAGRALIYLGGNGNTYSRRGNGIAVYVLGLRHSDNKMFTAKFLPGSLNPQKVLALLKASLRPKGRWTAT